MKNLIMWLTNIATVILFFSNLGQVKENIDGLWEGKVKFPGIETRIVFRIKIFIKMYLDLPGHNLPDFS